VETVFQLPQDSQADLERFGQEIAKFEKGQTPSLEQTDPVSQRPGDEVEGGWAAVDTAAGRQLRHRVVLAKNVLADVCYEASGLDDSEFGRLADIVLESVRVSAQ